MNMITWTTGVRGQVQVKDSGEVTSQTLVTTVQTCCENKHTSISKEAETGG